MATINPSDTTYNLVAEVTPGTTPATPAFTVCEYIPGSMPTFGADFVTSNVLQANRASAGGRKTNYKSGGSLKTQLRRGAHLDILMQSAVSGTYSTNVLKAGTTDSSFTVEKIFKAGATPYYHRFTGVQASDMTISCTATSNAEVAFNLIGMGRSASASAIASSTYTIPAATTYLNGLDVNTVTIAGLTATFRSLELVVSQNREAQDQFASPSARGIGTSGIRTVTLKLTFYRDDLSADTLLATSDTKLAVGVTIGTTGQGYSFSLPACNYDVPQDSEENSKSLITATFTASYDATSATDLVITKL